MPVPVLVPPPPCTAAAALHCLRGSSSGSGSRTVRGLTQCMPLTLLVLQGRGREDGPRAYAGIVGGWRGDGDSGGAAAACRLLTARRLPTARPRPRGRTSWRTTSVRQSPTQSCRGGATWRSDCLHIVLSLSDDDNCTPQYTLQCSVCAHVRGGQGAAGGGRLLVKWHDDDVEAHWEAHSVRTRMRRGLCNQLPWR